jgi:hypothetical protein
VVQSIMGGPYTVAPRSGRWSIVMANPMVIWQMWPYFRVRPEVDHGDYNKSENWFRAPKGVVRDDCGPGITLEVTAAVLQI